jgi:hypothetical protein
MRSGRVISEGQWQVMARQRDEIGAWLAQLRIEMDTNSCAGKLQERFEDLAKEYHAIELLMAN